MARQAARVTPEIRKAALRAAAKAAVVGMLAGCGGSEPKPAAPSNVARPEKPAASIDCATWLADLKTVKQDELPAGDPLKEKSDVYGAVFADRAARESPETQKCCTEELTANSAGSKLRWECCSALVVDPAGAACTPWGPPCPPEMPRSS